MTVEENVEDLRMQTNGQKVCARMVDAQARRRCGRELEREQRASKVVSHPDAVGKRRKDQRRAERDGETAGLAISNTRHAVATTLHASFQNSCPESPETSMDETTPKTTDDTNGHGDAAEQLAVSEEQAALDNLELISQLVQQVLLSN